MQYAAKTESLSHFGLLSLMSRYTIFVVKSRSSVSLCSLVVQLAVLCLWLCALVLARVIIHFGRLSLMSRYDVFVVQSRCAISLCSLVMHVFAVIRLCLCLLVHARVRDSDENVSAYVPLCMSCIV